ncbi:hypothetical protein [Sporomusa carbonis]|uniref:hypothetical protein n=1 Tax=Sporomusa carbonis TaxID=3076075 RepID=UPI003C7C8FA0
MSKIAEHDEQEVNYYNLQRTGGWCEPVCVTVDSAWEWLMMNLTGPPGIAAKVG